ncbi:MAG: type VI secretion system tip protein VgrG [Phycisphaerales bacterium]|nr:type VI secretion system tip protein VgrG [Phycisphaerales bacterium]
MPDLQANREIQVSIPVVGPDKLLIESFSITEEMGQPFSMSVRVHLLDQSVNMYKAVGQPLGVALRVADGSNRKFFGVVRSVTEPGNKLAGRVFTLSVGPKLWLASLSTNCKIFQKKKVPDIIKEVLKKYSVTIVDDLKEQYREWKFCVQYRETDLAFVTRLMEQEGISFYHTFSDTEDEMHLVDSSATVKAFKGYKEMKYVDPSGGPVEDTLTSFSISMALQTEKVTYEDYDFQAPTKELQKSKNVLFDHVQKGTEQYDYPGEYWEPADGDLVTKHRAEDIAAGAEIYHAEGSCRGVSVGHKFTLKDPTNALRAGLEREYMIISASIHGRNDDLSGAGQTGAGTRVQSSFNAIPANRVYRPAQRTRKPVITGPQTAVVVGPSGSEIYTDEHARVKVQFHWDRDGKMDENSSCWVRVSQTWAGRSWGSVILPRIGDEVIVEFAEGDPDRPIITGRLYNNDNKSPFKMPDNKNTLGLKSCSTTGGGGYNEISMDDTKGKEKVTIHAQYDMSTTVKHDQTNTVNNNRTTTIDVDDTEKVGSNQKLDVGADQTVKIGANQKTTIGANNEQKVGANQTVDVGSNQTTKVGANFKLDAGANGDIIIGANSKVSAGANAEYKSGAGMKIGAGATMEISAAATMEIKAGPSIKLSAGAGSIEIGPSGVKISGPMVEVTGGMIKNNG